MIISEQLYQYNVFNKKGTLKWLDYMDNFDEWCDGDWYSVSICRKRILNQVNITDEPITNHIETLNLWKSREVSMGFDTFP